MHTVKYWDKKLLSLQRLADSVGYDINNDPDYIAACACQTATLSGKTKKASADVLLLLYRVGERIESVRKWKEK